MHFNELVLPPPILLQSHWPLLCSRIPTRRRAGSGPSHLPFPLEFSSKQITEGTLPQIFTQNILSVKPYPNILFKTVISSQDSLEYFFFSFSLLICYCLSLFYMLHLFYLFILCIPCGLHWLFHGGIDC